MSSSDSEYTSPTGSSPDHLGADVLNQLDLVKSLINKEVWYNTRRVTRLAARENSQVQQRVAFFENKSLKNLTRASADFLHNIPIYQPGPPKGKHTVSAPVTPALSDSAESLVSTQSLPAAMPPNQDEHDFEGYPEPTPQWDRFVGRAAVATKHWEKRVAEITTCLQDEESPPTDISKKKFLNEAIRYLIELKDFKDEYHDITMRERVHFDNMVTTNTSLTSLENDLADIKLVIEEELPSTQIQQQPTQQPNMDTHLANMVSTVQNIANGPHVQLPYFSGTVTSYAGFKKQFIHTLKSIPGPPHLHATHLMNSLKGEAKKYIGDTSKWYDKYEGLWKNLDAKYGNRWVLQQETVRGLFFKPPPPADDVEAVKSWFFEAIDALTAIMELNLSMEEVGMLLIIETLPDEHRTELRNGLRTLYPGQRNACFKIETVRDIFNDTIGVKKDDNTPQKATLNLQAIQTNATTKNTQVSQPQTQVPPHTQEPYSRGRGGRGKSRGRGSSYANGATGTGSNGGGNQGYGGDPDYSRGSFYGRGQAPGRGAGQFRGASNGGYQNHFRNDGYNTANQTSYTGYSNNTQQSKRWCSLCTGPMSLTHPTFECRVYKTPAEKRQRLWNLGLCRDCTKTRHPGECSPYITECRIHTGVRHYTWLCEAYQQPQAQSLSQYPQFQQPQHQQNHLQHSQQQPPQLQQSQNQQYQQYNQMPHQGGQA